jgi:hypothetical protein
MASPQPNVLDIARGQGDNRFLVRLTNVGGDWSLGLKVTGLGSNVMPDVTYSAPRRIGIICVETVFRRKEAP